jgi:hypothetical protein
MSNSLYETDSLHEHTTIGRGGTGGLRDKYTGKDHTVLSGEDTRGHTDVLSEREDWTRLR